MLLLLTTITISSATALAADNRFKIPDAKNHDYEFFYGHQTLLNIYYETDKQDVLSEVGAILDKLDLELVNFGDKDKAYLVLKPMVYMATFGNQTPKLNGTQATSEIEFNVLVHPKSRRQPEISFKQFMRLKTVGNIGGLRLEVVADGEIAVAAGREVYGEHKFLAETTYSFPTPNNLVVGRRESLYPFYFNMSAYTWKGLGEEHKRILTLKADLEGAKEIKTRKVVELNYSSFPQEPLTATTAKTVGVYRRFRPTIFKAYLANERKKHIAIDYGEAEGGEVLDSVDFFGVAKPVPGSEHFPKQMVQRMKILLQNAKVIGFHLYKTPPTEFESLPFEIK